MRKAGQNRIMWKVIELLVASTDFLWKVTNLFCRQKIRRRWVVFQKQNMSIVALHCPIVKREYRWRNVLKLWNANGSWLDGSSNGNSSCCLYKTSLFIQNHSSKSGIWLLVEITRLPTGNRIYRSPPRNEFIGQKLSVRSNFSRILLPKI